MASPWPEFLINSFLSANQPRFANDESAFYGPYTRLLYHLFGVGGPYEITPQYDVFFTSREAVDAVAMFTVEFNKRPVLFIEVKSIASFLVESKRKQADDQMRDRFRDLRNSIVTPHLPALSAFGTRISFYDYDVATNSVIPPTIPADPICLNDRAPKERWNYDILEPEGGARVRQIVEQVKAMCQALNN